MGFFSSKKTKSSKKQKVMPKNADGSIAVETTKIMEITIVSVNNITRETDVVGKIDPYVIFYGNGQILGKTKPVDNATSCVLNELFTIKPKGAPRSIQFKFDLMDKDDIGDDDEVGSGTFNPAAEDSLNNQTVHLKWKGKDIGSLTIDIRIKDILVV
ncbi:uncharacterized protein LOC134814407 [Bolinopsis microptera]|uniref:uncharacterized protein LOC134814407 n=1 Tax=Bolinopsis microptera TaxID=2820187 RepID=UPI00307A8B0F